MRTLDYLSTALRDIVTQPLRCLLTVSAIALSSALLVALVSVGIMTRTSIIDHLRHGDTLSSVVVSASTAVNSGLFSADVRQSKDDSEKLTDDVVVEVAAIPHVVSAMPQLALGELRSIRFQGSDTAYVATAIATSQDSLRPGSLVAGSWFDNDDDAAKVVVGNAYLRALGITDPQSVIGQQVTFTTVVGYRGIGADIPPWSADKETKRTFARTRSELTATIVGVTAPSITDNRLYLPMGWGQLVNSPRTATPSGESVVNNLETNGYTNIVVLADSKESVASVARAVTDRGYGAITFEKQIDQRRYR